MVVVVVLLVVEVDDVLLVEVDVVLLVVVVVTVIVVVEDELEELLVDEVVVDVWVVVVAFVSPGKHGTKVPQILGHPGGGSSCNSITSFCRSDTSLFSAWGLAISPRG